MKKYELHSVLKLTLCHWKYLPHSKQISFSYLAVMYNNCLKSSFMEELLNYHAKTPKYL